MHNIFVTQFGMLVVNLENVRKGSFKLFLARKFEIKNGQHSLSEKNVSFIYFFNLYVFRIDEGRLSALSYFIGKLKLAFLSRCCGIFFL